MSWWHRRRPTGLYAGGWIPPYSDMCAPCVGERVDAYMQRYIRTPARSHLHRRRAARRPARQSAARHHDDEWRPSRLHDDATVLLHHYSRLTHTTTTPALSPSQPTPRPPSRRSTRETGRSPAGPFPRARRPTASPQSPQLPAQGKTRRPKKFQSNKRRGLALQSREQHGLRRCDGDSVYLSVCTRGRGCL